MLTEPDAYEKGTALREKMMGAGAARIVDDLADVSPELLDYVVSYLFGTIYQRPALDLKTRSICTISALTALGQTRQLKSHIRSGLRIGLTKEEVVEIILQLQVYAGLPKGLDALRAAKEAFAEVEAEQRA